MNSYINTEQLKNQILYFEVNPDIKPDLYLYIQFPIKKTKGDIVTIDLNNTIHAEAEIVSIEKTEEAGIIEMEGYLKPVEPKMKVGVNLIFNNS